MALGARAHAYMLALEDMNSAALLLAQDAVRLYSQRSMSNRRNSSKMLGPIMAFCQAVDAIYRQQTPVTKQYCEQHAVGPLRKFVLEKLPTVEGHVKEVQGLTTDVDSYSRRLLKARAKQDTAKADKLERKRGDAEAALAAKRAELHAEFAQVNAHRSDIASKEVVHMVVAMQDAMRRAAAALDPVVKRFPSGDVAHARQALAASHERGPLDPETFAAALQQSTMMTGLGHERANADGAAARKARRNSWRNRAAASPAKPAAAAGGGGGRTAAGGGGGMRNYDPASRKLSTIHHTAHPQLAAPGQARGRGASAVKTFQKNPMPAARRPPNAGPKKANRMPAKSTAVAMYKYSAAEDGELSFPKGATIVV